MGILRTVSGFVLGLFVPPAFALWMAWLAIGNGVIFTGRVSGVSMHPTVPERSVFIAISPLGGRTVAGGSIVIAELGGSEVIKRVVAVGGDEVALAGGEVFVNGERAALPVPPSLRGRAPSELAPYIVPAGHVFLIGDARGWSYDSREHGPVPLAQVRGVVVAHWLPVR